MTDLARRSRLRTLHRHLATEYARGEIGRSMFQVVVDGLELGPCSLTASDRDWLRGALAIPIQEATEVGLEVLAWRVDRILDGAPEPLRQRWDLRHAEELGWG